VLDEYTLSGRLDGVLVLPCVSNIGLVAGPDGTVFRTIGSNFPLRVHRVEDNTMVSVATPVRQSRRLQHQPRNIFDSRGKRTVSLRCSPTIDGRAADQF